MATPARGLKPLLVTLVGMVLGAGCGGSAQPSATPRQATPTAPAASSLPTFDPDTFPRGSLPDVLASDGRFDTVLLLFSEQMPRFLGFMSGPAFRHTFFLPIDDAFEDLPPGTVEALLEEENLDVLFDAFPTHLVEARLMLEDLETGPLVMAHERHTLEVAAEGGRVTIEGAVIVDTLEADNGIVHAVDTVLGLDQHPMAGPLMKSTPGQDLIELIIRLPFRQA